jgi:hypothetical protein
MLEVAEEEMNPHLQEIVVREALVAADSEALVVLMGFQEL